MIPQNLKDLEHFRTDPRVQFKEENVGGVDVVIPCYMIADAQFWDLPYARELRGHTYLKSTGELIGVAFHKFFNVGEREETLPHNINWDNVVDYTFDKMDGSMICPVVIDDGIGKMVYFKTKKSFYSDVALDFTKWFWEQPQAFRWSKGIIELADNGFTPIFEFFHPEWRVVLNYGDEPKIWLLNTRRWDNGDYYDGLINNPLPDMPKAPMEVWDNFKRDFLHLQETVTGVEGWIVYEPIRNEFYKVKTKWYLQQHRVQTSMRERDVAEMAALEKLDDVKSLVTEAGLDLSKIEWIEKAVSVDISSVRIQVEGVAAELMENNTSFKDAAAVLKGTPYFGMIMHKMRGIEPDYVGYFMKDILKKKYGLKNVYNENF